MAEGTKELPAYPIGSVDKALRLLVLVAEHPGGVRIGDTASALEVAPSTAHRLLQMLALHDFAKQDPVTKAYYPGDAMGRLSNRIERLREFALPLLTNIVDEFSETVHLSSLEESLSRTLFSVESPHMLRVGDRAGHTQPAYRSAMGRILLSEEDPKSIAAAAKALGGEDIDLDIVHRSQKLITEQGFIVQHGEIEAGVSAVAVPVRGLSGAVDYAIGVTYPTARIAEDEIPALVDFMKVTAAQLEIELRR